MAFSKRLILMFVVLIFCVGCDQATKLIAISNLPETETFSYLADTLRLQLSYNRGAFLSLGASLPNVLRHSIFTIAPCLLLIGFFGFAVFSKSATFPFVLAVSLFFAGGVGNLIDRIFRGGLVVDFLNVGIGPLRTGIFNVADIAIMAGTIILLYLTFRKQKDNR